MILSLNWLKTYVDLEGVSVDDIVDKLTASGLEVEEVVDRAKELENFVVGYVKEKKSHPNADKLSLCTVEDGEKDIPIVCGAPNVEAGQKIILAKVGAIIPEGNFKIKKAKIRGEVSEGMICSEKELGISENHEGIMVLNPEVKTGISAAEALGLDDVTMDISITPNRPDALSHIGIARDLAALYKKPLNKPSINVEEVEERSENAAAVEILNGEKCPRYSAKVVKNVKVQESPEWLKKRLISIGLRPINNVVDVTNYILHEVGQPLHAFDLDLLEGRKIVVKTAGEKKKFVTLDSKERELLPDDLMINDGAKEVAIAGVMGGENSEVTESTKNILLEGAYFNPSSVRKTAKHLGLSTDASYRFERGCNPAITTWAICRAAELIKETGGGDVLAGEIDVVPNKIEKTSVKLRYERINKVLGTKVEPDQVDEILQRLGFVITDKKQASYIIADVPLFRPDVEREIDLIEEVARIFGYNNIEPVEKIKVTLDPKTDSTDFKNNARKYLNALGSWEIVTNSLLNEETARLFGNPVKMLNPQSKEMSHTRPSLIPGLLSTISKNLKVKEKNLNLFEIGSVFEQKSAKIETFDDFSETLRLTIAITGKDIETEWYGADRELDFYDLKGLVEEFLKNILLDNRQTDKYHKDGNKLFEYYYAKHYNENEIGFGGKISKQLLKFFDINQDVYLFDFNLEKLSEIEFETKKFNELLKFPKVLRDMAFILDKTADSAEVVNGIKNAGSGLLKNVKLFDIFEGKGLGEGKKSLAFQLEFYHPEKTLTEEEVDKDFRKIIEAVKKKFDAQLRGE